MFPIFRFTVLFLLSLAILGCSTSKTAFVHKEGNQQTRGAIDTSRPTTFEEYRQWRKANDPNGQTYAEYKQWEAAYKQWLEQQAQAATR